MKNRSFKAILKLLYAGLFFALVFNACTPAYVPNVINTPLLSNKGEFQCAIHTGTAGNDPQFAYAITDNIGVMLNGSFANRTSDSTDDFHKHQFVEIGSGYFTKLGNSGRFEVFGGFGLGKLKAKLDNNLWMSYEDVTSNRIFIQPAIGAATEIFDASLAARFVMVNMKQSSAKNTGLFLEPVMTTKVGYKYVKLVFQLGLSFPLNSKTREFSYQPFIFSIGLNGYIGRNYNDYKIKI